MPKIVLRGDAPAHGLDEIVGHSGPMEELYRIVRKTLRGNLTVAIQGESGTGKELVARAIHFNARPRPGQEGTGPFVTSWCRPPRRCARSPHNWWKTFGWRRVVGHPPVSVLHRVSMGLRLCAHSRPHWIPPPGPM